MLAATAPALLAVMAIAADYANMVKIRAELQVAADAAALAGAKEFGLSGSTDKQIIAVATAFATESLSPSLDGQSGLSESGAELGAVSKVSTSVVVNHKKASVKVAMARSWAPFFLHFIAREITPIKASATAQVLNASPICVLGLSEDLPSGVTLWKNASLTAEGCTVYSNTKTVAGIVVSDNATLKAQVICVAGGYMAGSAKAVVPQPTTDCPMIADPLAARKVPTVGLCSHVGLIVKDQARTLDPGVYCGGLTVMGSSKVTFNPGVYIIHNGPFTVLGSASIVGEHVGFYLSGNASMFMFDSGSTVDLSAPADGLLAGLLFFEDRSKVLPLRIHRIGSNNARRLIGTVYLSRGTLLIDATAPVADNSAYTALVVRSLQLTEGPKVVLRSDFKAANVPVPEGLMNGRVVLSQ